MAIEKNNFKSGGLLIRHEGFLRHKGFRFLKIALTLSVIGTLAYLFADVQPRPNGGSWIGYALGVISAFLIIWLMLLGLRKRAITPGRWSLKGWTSAHVYLGSSLLILATLHTGFQFGLNVHTLAYGLMVFVIISGFVGVYFYATIPQRMSDNRAERSEADLIQELRNLDRELKEAAQPLDQKYIKVIERAIARTKIRVGVFTSLDAAQRYCPTTRAFNKLQKIAHIADETMRRPLDDVISILQRKSALLLRTRRHIRYKNLLQFWLYFHVPVSFALLAALTAHIISVFFYW